MQDARSLPGVSRLVCGATKEFPRVSEADVIELTDGRLFLAVGRKQGASDYAPGTIIGMFSGDGGRTWDDQAHVVQAPWGDRVDLMSVSLCRSWRGVYLFFLARGREMRRDTRVQQMISTDECRTWSKPEVVGDRAGYHVVNNARVIVTKGGRMIVPCAYVQDVQKNPAGRRIYCIYSDDQGRTWKASNDLVLEGKPLMEPGVAECADGSIYMTIRTTMKKLWEARSIDGGATWGELQESPLASPAAPSTVMRDPTSETLWMFWCNIPEADWKGRSRQVFAVSKDHGKTWSEPRTIEEDPKRSFGYISVDVVQDHALLTYYDWRDKGQGGFVDTSLRQRMIPIGWLRGEIVPPVFRAAAEPVLKKDQEWEGDFCSVNSGIVVDGLIWKMWYTNGDASPGGEQLRVCFAQSGDLGVTWSKPLWADSPVTGSNIVLPGTGDGGSYYHASVHREGERLVAFVWRQSKGDDSCLHRFVSSDEGKTFKREPERPMMSTRWSSAALKKQAGEGRESNDAFDVIRDPRRHGWVYYAACLEDASDPRMVVKHDNVPGIVRVIGRAQSADGIEWSPVEIIIRPEYHERGEWKQQFYGMQVFRYGDWWLGLLHTYFVESQTIQPEWAWSHDGISWVRTRTPCISLGDEGAWDSRMILFGDVIQQPDELVWIYSGNDWRHNGYVKGKVRSHIGRATVSRRALDDWLATLPQP